MDVTIGQPSNFICGIGVVAGIVYRLAPIVVPEW